MPEFSAAGVLRFMLLCQRRLKLTDGGASAESRLPDKDSAEYDDTSPPLTSGKIGFYGTRTFAAWNGGTLLSTTNISRPLGWLKH
jgi:hypothetical protein